MKKTIVIEILLAFIFAVLIACCCPFLKHVAAMNEYIEEINGLILNHPNLDYSTDLKYYNAQIDKALAYAIPMLIAAIADIAVMVVIAIKDFPIFKSLKNKFKARKEQRAAAKAEQAAVAKQQRIEKLQAELDELKKDE
ncbi:MAG: hypothetical protein J1G01_04560 [Clostridiales bacterium]|nr:hypothetical protein [Clostridiales bacterium]